MDDQEKLALGYSCCQHCEHFDGEPLNAHTIPCPDGCNNAEAEARG